MKTKPLPANIKKLRLGSHIGVKKITAHRYSPVAQGFEAKGYVMDDELSPQVLYVLYYWSKRSSAADGHDWVNVFHTSFITGHTGHVIHTRNSDYEIFDLGVPIDVPDFETVLRQFWRQQYWN